MEPEQRDDNGSWVFLRNDQLFQVNDNDDLQPLLLRVITERQYERFRMLEESYKREKV